MKKQKIEDIFSSMEDFSSVPPPELWSQIEEKLDKPKKKKRVVLWWSAAACLLLGLLLPSILHFTASSENTNLNNGNLENNTNSVVIDKKTNNVHTGKDSNRNKNTGKAIDSLNENSPKNQFNSESQIQVQETSVVETNSENKTSKRDSKSNVVVPANTANQSVAYQNSGSSEEKSIVKSSKKSILENNTRSSNKGISEERIAFGKQSKFNSTAKKQLSNSIFEEQLTAKNSKNIAFTNQGEYAANNNPFTQSSASNSNNAVLGKTENKRTDKAVIIKDDLKITNGLSKTDSMQLAELQNLEKGILTPEKKKEEKEKKDNLINKNERWAVAVFAGVANSENTKNEKTLGNVNDSKQSNSYGVKTKYSINKKWAVGSGLKISELGQSVANVSYLSAKSNAFFNPGTLNADSNNSPVVSADPSSQGYLFISNSTKEALKNENVQTGKLDQNLRYVEMPLEVSYSVFNKNKASINLNTGGFVGKLISNNVALDGHSIGENMNANDYVYGSTLSSTVQYRVYKKTNVFVEPTVNYYINPLNSQSFNQFQWGLNFGLNVNF
ncbi:hypothetical protein AAYQ05_21530 [Flavobacterium sp. B11]|uniref:hypothetical protein n=1 Tax=Flavobacterium movens TaxID=214860 RepID=UPI0031CF1CBE